MVNTQSAKQHLTKAFQLLNDYTLDLPKSLIKKAILEIEHVESKKTRRQTVQLSIEQEWKEKLAKNAAGRMDTSAAKFALDEIDRQMKIEQDKLNQAKPDNNVNLFG